MFFLLFGCKESFNQGKSSPNQMTETGKDTIEVVEKVVEEVSVLDTALYNKLMLHLVDQKPSEKWPVKGPYPLNGALLPFNRIIAYYGNLYTSRMGILGSNPSDQMLKKLMKEVDYWQNADSLTKVIPALHYIAVTAQSKPGNGSMYRLRMPDSQIDKVLALSESIGAITFLDIQPGHSTVQKEVPMLEKYLKMENVHLGLDPEWTMKGGERPGSKIGTMDAKDINFAVQYLAKLVKDYNLPPKVLVVHRFTKGMLTNYKDIKTCPEVQIVINMDGFGFPAKKVDSYKRAVASEPVQFTGFKLFYKNDKLTAPNRLMTAKEILNLHPKPMYIQYQ